MLGWIESAGAAVVDAGTKKQKIGQIMHEKKLKSSEIQKILFDGIII